MTTYAYPCKSLNIAWDLYNSINNLWNIYENQGSFIKSNDESMTIIESQWWLLIINTNKIQFNPKTMHNLFNLFKFNNKLSSIRENQ